MIEVYEVFFVTWFFFSLGLIELRNICESITEWWSC